MGLCKNFVLPLLTFALLAGSFALTSSRTDGGGEFVRAGIGDLSLIMNADDSVHRVELAMHVVVGSLHEKEEEQGYAHLLEHMAFNGTQDYPGEQMQATLQSLGLPLGQHVNATTSFDSTIYRISLIGDQVEKIDEAIVVLAQWARHITIDPEQLELEKSVVLEEWRRSEPEENSGWGRYHRVFYNSGRHAERWPIGTPASIREATVERLMQFYRREYRPDQITLVATGDIDPGQITALTERHFGDWTVPDKADELDSADVYDRAHSLTPDWPPEAVYRDADQSGSWLMLSLPVELSPPLSMEDGFDGWLLRRAMEIVRDRVRGQLVTSNGALGGAESVYHSLSAELHRAAVLVYSPMGDVDALPKALGGSWKSVRDSGLTASAFEGYRRAWTQSLKTERNTAEVAMHDALAHLRFGSPLETREAMAAHYLARLDALDVEGFNRWLAERLAPTPFLAVIAGENESATVDVRSAFGSAPAIESAAAVVVADTDKWSLPSVSPESPSQTEQVDPTLTRWRYGNGLTVVHRHSEVEPGQVRWALYARGGFDQLSQTQTRVARVALQTMGFSGLRQHDGESFQLWLVEQGFALNPIYSFVHRGVTGHGPAADIDRQLRVLYSALSEAKTDAWPYFQRLNIEELQRGEELPMTAWTAMHAQRIFQQDVAFRAMTVEELLDIDERELQRLYIEQFAGAQNYVLAVVGDVEASTVQAAVDASMGALPASGVVSDIARSMPREREDMSDQVMGSEERHAKTVLRYSVAKNVMGEVTAPAMYQVSQWIREALFREVRERQGLVYSINVAIMGGSYAEDAWTLTVEFDCDPEKVEDVVAAVDIALVDAVSTPTDPQLERLQKVVSGLVESQVFQNPAVMAHDLAFANVLNWPIESVLDPDFRSPLLTAEQVDNVVAKFAAPEAVRAELVWLP